MKTEFAKFLVNKSLQSFITRIVEAIDNMTENQIAAWVKDFYEDK